MTTLADIEFIIPCGGKSSRNYPHSKGIAHKSLLPFGDGRLIDFILENIVAIGGRHITIVCSSDDVIDIFKEALKTDTQTEEKLRTKGLAAIADAIRRTFLPEQIDLKFTIQEKPLGTAHVLALAHRLSPNRHGVMIFPDDIVISKDKENNYLKRMVDAFLTNPKQILLYGVPKENVSNNAILDNKRLIEKPQNPTNFIALYSPVILPKETLDFIEKQFCEIEKTGQMPAQLSGGEWVYVDGINAFLDAEPADTPFYIAVIQKTADDLLLDTGTLPLYQQAQIYALLKLSKFSAENKKYALKLLLDDLNIG